MRCLFVYISSLLLLAEIISCNSSYQNYSQVSHNGWSPTSHEWMPVLPIKYVNQQYRSTISYKPHLDTTTSQSIPILPSVCKDTSPDCQNFALQNGCSIFENFMKANCPFTCNTCRPTTNNNDCIDQHFNCAAWGQQNQCDINPAFMLVTCPATCSSCPPTETSDCIDYHESCFFGFLLGQCEENPSFYLSFCLDSCGSFISQCQSMENSKVEDVCENRDFDCGIDPNQRTNSAQPSSIPVIMKRHGNNKLKYRMFLKHRKGNSIPLPKIYGPRSFSDNTRHGRYKRSLINSIIPSSIKNMFYFSVDVYNDYETRQRDLKKIENIRLGRQSLSDTNLREIYESVCIYVFNTTSFFDSVNGKHLDIVPDVTSIQVDVCILVVSIVSTISVLSFLPSTNTNPQFPDTSRITPPPSPTQFPTQPIQQQPTFQPPSQPPRQPPSQPPRQPPSQPPLQSPFQPPLQPPSQPPLQPVLPPILLVTAFTSPEILRRVRTLVPFCNPDGYLSLIDKLQEVRSVGNSGRPIPESIGLLLQTINFCQNGVGSPSNAGNLGILLDDSIAAIRNPPSRWPGISYPSLYLSVLPGSILTRDFRSSSSILESATTLNNNNTPVYNSNIANNNNNNDNINDNIDNGNIAKPYSINNIISVNRRAQIEEVSSLNEIGNLGAFSDEIIGNSDIPFKQNSEGPREVTFTSDKIPRSAWKCGGSLISPHHILTAAHCVLPENKPTVVRLGEIDFEQVNESEAYDYDVQDVQIHPGYRLPQKYNDIAIITLKQKVNFNEFVRPYCYPTERRLLDGQICTISGWGTQPNQPAPSVIHNLPVQIVNTIECENEYRDIGPYVKIFETQYPNGFTDSLMCAGRINHVCRGDSGGPLVYDSPEGLSLQVGIVSTGYGCSVYPGVYTRVDSYTDWIDSVVFSECESTSDFDNELSNEIIFDNSL